MSAEFLSSNHLHFNPESGLFFSLSLTLYLHYISLSLFICMRVLCVCVDFIYTGI